jgi:hypothetical protein
MWCFLEIVHLHCFFILHLKENIPFFFFFVEQPYHKTNTPIIEIAKFQTFVLLLLLSSPFAISKRIVFHIFSTPILPIYKHLSRNILDYPHALAILFTGLFTMMASPLVPLSQGLTRK